MSEQHCRRGPEHRHVNVIAEKMQIKVNESNQNASLLFNNLLEISILIHIYTHINLHKYIIF